MCLSLLLMKLRVTVQKIVLKNIHIIILYVKTGLKYTKFLGWVDRSEIGTLCCQLAYANLGTVNSAVPVPVKSTGVRLILVLPQDEKS
jgi:hypothetical protein